MKRILAVVSVMALAAVSCASGGGPADGVGTPAHSQQSRLQDLTGDRLCELLPGDSVAQALDVTVQQSEGSESGRAPVMKEPYFLRRECRYDTEGFPSLATDVTTNWRAETSDKEVLDQAFAFPEESPGTYEPVSDLGALAGFGNDAALAKADVAGQALGVVLKAGDERFLLTLSTIGRADRDQLELLARALVLALESELR